MGGLRVYAFEKKKSIKHGERKFLWEKLDDQKNKWHVARITYTPHYQVEVRCVCVCGCVCVLNLLYVYVDGRPTLCPTDLSNYFCVLIFK